MGMNLLRRHTVHTFIRNWVIKTKPVLHTLLKLFVSGQKEWKNWNSNDLEQAQKPCGRPVFLYHSNTGLYQWKHIQNPIFQLVLHSTEILVPAFGKFKDCDDLNLSFVSRADFVTDPDFLNNFEIRTNSSASTISSH